MAPRAKVILYAVLGLVLLGALAAGLWINTRVSSYQHLLHYQPDQDYRYDFSQTEARRVPVEVDEQGFIWPVLEHGWDTAFLELNLQSDLLGALYDPYIEVSHGALKFPQFFERRAKGVRYVNLSPLASAHLTAGQQVELEGLRLSWPRQQAHLVLFRNHIKKGARVLVVAPHPDDAEIAAFGLYSHGDSYIVTITAGEAGGDYYQPFPENTRRSHRLKGELRVWDSMTVPYWGGLRQGRVCNLGYFDATLSQMYHHPEQEATSPFALPANMHIFRRCDWAALRQAKRPSPTWKHLVTDLADVLRGLRPDIIVTPHPLLDWHPDHRYATLALFQAIEEAKLSEGQLLLYTNHDILSEMYPFGKDVGLVSLPPWFDKGWFFSSVYSYEINQDVQTNKYFALDAMHDLRASTDEDEGDWELLGSWWDKFIADSLGLGDATSYFRRAVRPNELFFVIPVSQSQRLNSPSQAALK